MIGKTLGTFTLEAQIGKGGMGEVYKAKDQKLGRDVAIKVLPEEFAKDTDRLSRFQREAKLLASLNHPNIAAIYGLEESDGTHFLVLELIEGDTLAGRIKSGPIPVEEALKLALQIAEALEAAHEKGVIHRDLKPANIKVTPDGKVKVLDFGLAKAYAGEQEDINLSNSPTLSAAATQQGVILGTAAYMSPEQAKGKTVDMRTDVWAFGCVVFEMLSGQSVFAADDVSQTLARVLEREPNFSTLPPNLHPRIRFLLERCLKKEPKNRYSSIRDARVEIQEVLADPNGVFSQTGAMARPRKQVRLRLAWFAVAIVLSLIIAGVAVWYLKPVEPRQLIRFDYDLPEDEQFSAPDNPFLAVSPDGRQFVYSTSKGLYLHSIDKLGAKFVPGTNEAPRNPFFSPDGQWIAYWSSVDNKLKKIAVNGGVSVDLCDTASVTGASWGKDGFVVYGDSSKGIMRVSANGGTPKPLAKLTGSYVVDPQILPDGKTLMFSIVSPDDTRIVLQSLESGEQKVLCKGDKARYVQTGHLVYLSKNDLYAVPFDLGRLEITGTPIPMLGDVFRTGPLNAPQCDISDAGTLVYVPETAVALCKLVWVDRKGVEEALAAEANSYGDFFKISPDGTQVALTVIVGGKQDIYIWDLIRKSITRLTFDNSADTAGDSVPIWTRDSKKIIFNSLLEGRNSIFFKAADGSGKVEKLASLPERHLWPWSLSNNGNFLFFGETGGEGGYNIGMLSMDGDHTPKLLLHNKFNEGDPQISPDGRWLAYNSDELSPSQPEVYVRSFPDVDSGGKWQVSSGGGRYPLWSPNGRELFYVSPDGVMAVSVETDRTFRRGRPQRLFSGPYLGCWDISSDGKRFLMLKSSASRDSASEAIGPHKINIVLNWFEELKEQVPVD
jgi:serine/threonine-protein kinase